MGVSFLPCDSRDDSGCQALQQVPLLSHLTGSQIIGSGRIFCGDCQGKLFLCPREPLIVILVSPSASVRHVEEVMFILL